MKLNSWIILLTLTLAVVACTNKLENPPEPQVVETQKDEPNKTSSPLLGLFVNEFGDSIELLGDKQLILSRVLQNEIGTTVCQIQVTAAITKVERDSGGQALVVHFQYKDLGYTEDYEIAKKGRSSELGLNIRFCERMYKQYNRRIGKDLSIEINKATDDVIELKYPLMSQMDSDTARFFYRKK